MKTQITTAAAVATLTLAATAHAEKIEITQVGLTWSPATVTAAPGDTLVFIRQNGTHTVTSGTDCTFGGTEFTFDEPLNAANPIVEILVPEGLTITSVPFFCAPHCVFDMVGEIIIEAPACEGDLDESGEVDFADLVSLLAAWGPCPGCPQDLNASGAVDFSDLVSLLSAWGPC